jgi:hypothetical protein
VYNPNILSIRIGSLKASAFPKNKNPELNFTPSQNNFKEALSFKNLIFFYFLRSLVFGQRMTLGSSDV